MHPVKNVGKPCAGEPHARFDGRDWKRGRNLRKPRQSPTFPFQVVTCGGAGASGSVEAAASRSCVCDDNTIEGGCCRQDRCRAGRRKRTELLGLLRPCFARVEPWLQAGKYAAALMSQLPRRNGWTIAEHAGNRPPDKTQRLLNWACWDTAAAMAVMRRFAWPGWMRLRRAGRRGLAVGAVDETGQVKQVSTPPGSSGTIWGCVGKVANGITTVHLAYGEHRACADRIPAVDPGRTDRRSGEVAGDGPARGSGVPHQGPAGHRPTH